MKKKCYYCGIKKKKRNMHYYEVNDCDGYIMWVCNECKKEYID